MLELAVLGLLKEQAMHGYELKKRLNEQLGHFWQFSYGSLYPTLKRLSADEAVEMLYPAGKEASSRRKKVYRVTRKGEDLFQRLLEESGPAVAEGREAFMLRLAFFRYMKPESRRRLLEGRRGYLQQRLQKMLASLKTLRDRMDAYTIQLMSHGVAEARHDIKWLDELLEAESRMGTEPPPPTPRTTVPAGPVEG